MQVPLAFSFLSCDLLAKAMSVPTNPTRQKLIQAALELFAAQGIGTTTRKIAEHAEVNEVTLFRHFGNKSGLLLAVFEDSEAFRQIGESLVRAVSASPQANSQVDQTLRVYASECLHAMKNVSQLICSVVGEADQYPSENRRALGQGLVEVNRQVAQYLEPLAQNQSILQFSPETLVSLMNSLLLGYAIIEFTSDKNPLWESQDDFLDSFVQLFSSVDINALSSADASDWSNKSQSVSELPANLVHEILRHARKRGSCDYALAYVLFAAGLSPKEIEGLERSHHVSDAHRHLLKAGVARRQVPVNQWILDRRYGSYNANPLTKYLRSRKDSHLALFLGETDQPITVSEIEERWQLWITEGVSSEIADPNTQKQTPMIAQAQQTWCIDMLLRGVTSENLSILSGWELEKLKPYAERAKELLALEQATRLDHKNQAVR
jgi:AcrR family transcriptional regulator